MFVPFKLRPCKSISTSNRSKQLTAPASLGKLLGLMLLFLAVTFTGNLAAETSIGIGYDLARQLDSNQDDGQVNLSVQASVGRRSALVVDLAQGERYTNLEMGFKRYNEKYLSGSYFQLGANYWYGDKDKGAKSKLGGELRLGYEQPLTRNLVAFGAVSMLVGHNNSITGKEEDLIFRPHLGLMFHF